MPSSNSRNLGARFQTLRRDLGLLLRRLSPTPLLARNYLDPAYSAPFAAVRTMLMTVIIPFRIVLMIMLKLHSLDSSPDVEEIIQSSAARR
jgi:hypothetical protein